MIESKVLEFIKINNVPVEFWGEFRKDAKERFANNYLMKMMHDHIKASNVVNKIDSLAEWINGLQLEVESLRSEVEELKKHKPKVADVKEEIKPAFRGFGKRIE
ncbi:MAG: hypothetical protein U9O94_04010 [Nanoarchaeota archaeon]|nr:hypothetical protein [Nanoarchaeota archaeon]